MAEDFVSEDYATQMTGVTPATLSRFAEAGYFQIRADAEGKRMFRRAELEELFGFADINARQEVVDGELVSEKAEILKEIHLSAVEPIEATTESSAEAKASAPEEGAASVNGVGVRVLADQLQRELGALRASLAIQERVMQQKDSEIKDLKEQRDWLRLRIERLEEKGERDQLLILSETQVIRRFVAAQYEKKSPFRAALGWLGIAEPAANSQTSHVHKD